MRQRAASGQLVEDVGRRILVVCHRDCDSTTGYYGRQGQRGVLPRLARLPERMERGVPMPREDRCRGRGHLLREMRTALLLLQHGRPAGPGELR